MSQMKKVLSGLSLLAFVVCGSLARADELTPAKRADILHLFELTGAGKIGDQMAVMMVQQMRPALLSCKGCTAQTADVVQHEVLGLFRENISAPGGLLDRQVPIYDKRFTHDEIKQLIAFYESPIGRKLTGELPGIMADGVSAGQQWSTALRPELQRRIREALEREHIQLPLK